MEVVDLTHPLTPETIVVAGDPPVRLARVRTHDADGHQVTEICLGSHAGTHLDAPRHFFPDGPTLDSYPVERLVRPGWVVDLWAPSSPAPPSPSNLLATIGPGPVAQAGTESLPMVGAAATLATGSAPYAQVPPYLPVPGEERIYGLQRIGAAVLAERLRDVDLSPGDFLLLRTGGALLDEEAAQLLLQTGAGLVGTDGPGLDEEPYPVHRLLLGAGVLLAENLANLERLGPGRVTCAFLPLAFTDSDGAPVRAVAWR
jgi:kynurenine formamidase